MADITYFAKTNFRGQDKIFGIREKDRLQHMYIIGQTGTGKTTLLKNLAVQDIKSGQGLAVIDPHGEFVEELLSAIPIERSEDVIYFNPVDSEYPIGFNILEVKNPDHKHLVASGLMAIFTKIWAGVWSARMEYILNNCVLALLDTPETTLMGIPRLLVDKEYRKKIVGNIKDPVVRSFWAIEYESWEPRFRNEAIVPIQNKVGQFLATKMIRNIVGQPKSTLDIEDIIENRKILLVNVSKGLIGEDNSALLGAMLITKIQLTAMERIKTPTEERHPFFLHVDEFQNFATDAFATILSEARKYGLALIISHQYIGQLVTQTSTRVRDAIFGNVGTLLSFRVGAIDAEFLESQFAPEIMAIDLVNLPNHNIYLKLLVDGISSRPFSALTLPPIPVEKENGIKGKIIEISRRKYGNSREVVEKMIEKWSQPLEKPVSSKAKPEKSKENRFKEKAVSLNELVKREPEDFKKKVIKPDLEGVRRALEEAIEKK
jgi:energy-coupling factor transporter ATP-binding protein EcfA2